MKNLTVVLLVIAAVSMGCTETVPPGYVGMVMQPSGLTGTPLQPGRHSCWGRDDMILIETKEFVQAEPLEILVADDLKFGFSLKIQSRLKAKDGGAIKKLLNRQGSNMVDGKLSVEPLYKTYISPPARSVARSVVSDYKTTEIRDNRDKIQKDIFEQLGKVLKGSPMELVAAYPSDFSYPKVITNAVELKRQREIEIDTEKAEQAKKLLKAKNRAELAQAEKLAKVKEAEADAAYNLIISKSITPTYLERLKINVESARVEALQTLYEKVGAGDKVIVTGNGPIMPMVGK